MASVDLASITSNTNASLDYAGYLMDGTNGGFVLTLPDMSSMGDGPQLILDRIDVNNNVNIVIFTSNTTINTSNGAAPYINIPIQTSYTIVYFNGVWNLTEANDSLLTNNYKFDYVYAYGIPTIYSAFEDIMDIVTLTCYDDSAVLCKINSII